MQHTRVQPDQVEIRLEEKQLARGNATCCATGWVPSKFLMNGH